MNGINTVQHGLTMLNRLVKMYDEIEYPDDFPELVNDLRKLIIDLAKEVWKDAKLIPLVEE